MKVLIVAKTRRGGGACVGGITWGGRSVRLMARDADTNERAGLEYAVGEVWEMELRDDPHIIPPHVENVIVQSARRLAQFDRPEKFIYRYMPPVIGGPEHLFDGLLQRSPSGALYIGKPTGLPKRSTMFWIADQPLNRDTEGKRIRYRYGDRETGRTITFVGFQEPIETIPQGALLRVSLAHWWQPRDKPDEELRCYAQLSGWFLKTIPVVARSAQGEVSEPTATEALRQSSQRATEAIEVSPAQTPTGRSRLDEARRLLKQTFGFDDFLPVQETVISHLIEGQDALAVMPTGGGKSLCYQLPALLLNGITVVVSPLIALMQDQVSQLRELDVPAACLNSTVPIGEYVRVTSRVREGTIRLVYVAPETLLRPETLLLFEQQGVACLAVDEAHCMSEWGHDFRPEYRELGTIRKRFASAVCVALTATATVRVRADIRSLLGISEASEFISGFNRPNLFLTAEPRRDGLAQTVAFLEKHRDQSGIIYCTSRQQVDELSTVLSERNWTALPYHAGLPDNLRHQNQNQFIRDEATIMVATVAFGMGINKSNVRFILHYNLPKDLESYYQEIGRAGRDGLPADCLLLYSRADAIAHRHFIKQGAESERRGREIRLEAMIRYAETTACRRALLLSYFGETPSEHCGGCDHCVAVRASAEQVDVTMAAQKFLSCVKRTGELFGAGHIIDVLRASRAKKVLGRAHDRLSTYGIGREYTASEWRDLAEQFRAQGLVEQDVEFGGLSITAKGWRVLKGEQVFVARVDSPASPSARPRAEHDVDLFERLRKLRHMLAVEADVPAYVIFSDRTLMEMATIRPQNELELLDVHGVGAAKLARYGRRFLDLIRGSSL